jgi:purine-binding chemotaxis protein CheW
MSASTDQVSVGGDVYLTLRALGQTFALPIEFARSVFKIEGLTRVPRAPSHLVGLSNLRGGIVGVVCLASKLDPDAPALGAGALAVAVELGTETFALAVQEIGEVMHAQGEDISPAAKHVNRWQPAMMTGIIRSGAKLLPVLDPFGVFDIGPIAEAA